MEEISDSVKTLEWFYSRVANIPAQADREEAEFTAQNCGFLDVLDFSNCAEGEGKQ